MEHLTKPMCNDDAIVRLRVLLRFFRVHESSVQLSSEVFALHLSIVILNFFVSVQIWLLLRNWNGFGNIELRCSCSFQKIIWKIDRLACVI